MRSVTALAAVLALAFSSLAQDPPSRSEKWKKAAGRTGDDWIPVVWSSDSATPYSMWSVHKTRYTRDGDEFAGWLRSDAVPSDKLSSGKTYIYSQMRFFARCSKTQYRIGATTYYAGDGTVVASDDGSPSYEWSDAGPETFGDAMITFVCTSTDPAP